MRSAYSLPPNCMIANCQDLDSQFGKKLPKEKNYHLFLTTILHFFSTERREKRTRSFVFLIFFFFFFPSPLSPQMLDKTCISVSSSHNRVRLLRRYLVSIFKGSPFTRGKKRMHNKRMSNRQGSFRRVRCENLPKIHRGKLSRFDEICFRENGKTVHARPLRVTARNV